MMLDLRNLLNLELCEECSRTLGWKLGLQADAGSSSRSGRNRGAAAGSGRKREAADEVDVIGPGSSS